MPGDDELERLLREVDAATSDPPAKAPAQRPGAGQAAGRGATDPSASGGGARASWTLVGAAGGGATGLLSGLVLTLLPGFGPLSTGIGGAIGGAAVAFASGAPDWFARRRGSTGTRP
jgi:hypothetical protein